MRHLYIHCKSYQFGYYTLNKCIKPFEVFLRLQNQFYDKKQGTYLSLKKFEWVMIKIFYNFNGIEGIRNSLIKMLWRVTLTTNSFSAASCIHVCGWFTALVLSSWAKKLSGALNIHGYHIKYLDVAATYTNN